jgi:acetoin:2,6-dichlorophenolindophenol oxidoreductase subunit beta
VGEAGGAFGASKGLQERFGINRVRDTPISEAVIVGTAVGAAMTGLRPIVEVMFMDFMGLAMDQLVNQAAKMSYMSGGAYRVPMVVRTICGAGRSTGPQHGQSFEGWLANIPGLKVVWPSNPSDAYGLIRSAVADDNPVIVIESLRLWTIREDIEEFVEVPLGQAAVRRTGTEVTVVTWGAAVHRTLAAAQVCATRGIDSEVIDLRSISPIDENAILISLEKTGRLIIVEDGPARVGVGTQVAALAAGAGFAFLKAPITIVASPFAPVPFAPQLEAVYFPSDERIAEAIRMSVEVEL